MTASDGSTWLQTVTEGMAASRFKISSDVSCGDRTFPAVAHRSRFELTKFGNCETFFVFEEFDSLSPAEMRRFSAEAFTFAKAARKLKLPCGLFEAVFCFAVAIVDGLDDATAEAVRNEVPQKHWAAGEIPVVYDRAIGQLCYFEKTPMWGAAYYAGFRKQISKFLTVD